MSCVKPALVINSHSSCLECLNLFFFCFEKFINKELFSFVYLFIDDCEYAAPNYVKVIHYNKNISFQEQMVYCLPFVEEDVILYCNEDYLFYEKPDYEKLASVFDTLVNSDYSFIKFVHTDIESYSKHSKNLFIIDKNSKNNFSQALSLWKTKDFLLIHKSCPKSSIGSKGDSLGHLEIFAQKACRDLDISGLCYYNGEPKRGLFHFDSDLIPHIASAVNRGAWTTEYPELNKLKEDFASSKKP